MFSYLSAGGGSRIPRHVPTRPDPAPLDAECRRAAERLALATRFYETPKDRAIQDQIARMVEEDGYRFPDDRERAFQSLLQSIERQFVGSNDSHGVFVDPDEGLQVRRFTFVVGDIGDPEHAFAAFAAWSSSQSYRDACRWGLGEIRNRLKWVRPIDLQIDWDRRSAAIYQAGEAGFAELARGLFLDAVVDAALWHVIWLQDALEIAAERIREHGLSMHELAEVGKTMRRLDATDHHGSYGPIDDDRIQLQAGRELLQPHDQSARRAIRSIKQFGIKRGGRRLDDAIRRIEEMNQLLDRVVLERKR